MKHISIIIAAAAIMALTLTAYGEKAITAEDLPKAAQKYIDQHFPESNILIVKQDRDGLSKTYEVKLDNGMELEFDSDGAIVDVDN